jgi:hypothetical protein
MPMSSGRESTSETEKAEEAGVAQACCYRNALPPQRMAPPRSTARRMRTPLRVATSFRPSPPRSPECWAGVASFPTSVMA